MNQNDSRQVIMIALLHIERTVGMSEVPMMMLWDAVKSQLKMSDCGVALREMRDSGQVLVGNDTVELTDTGKLAAEKIDGRQGCGANECLDSQRLMGEAPRGGGTPGRSERSVDAPNCSGPEIPSRDRDKWLMDIGRLALTDVVTEYGYNIPHFSLMSCIAFRLTQAGSDAIGFDSAETLRILSYHGMVAVLGLRTRLLSSGFRAVSAIQTMKRLSLQT